MHNWGRYPSSNCYKIDQKNVVLNLALCCGAIWRHREKLQFRCITTLAPVHNYQKKILKNLLPIWLLVRTNLFAPSHFWIPDAKFDNCCWGYIAKSGKNSVLCSKILQWIFSWNLSDIYTKQCAQTFPPIFEVFTIFDHYFPKIVAPPSNENKNYLARLKEQSLLKKRWKRHHNRPINGDIKPAESKPPRTNSAPASEHDKKTDRHTNTIFSHLQLVRIVLSSPNFAWW